MAFDRETMCRVWPKLAGPLALLEKWDAPRGIIFESDRESAWEAANAVARHLGGSRETFDSHPIRKEDWNERVARFTSGTLPPGALHSMGKEQLCIVVVDLDRQPEWLQIGLKAPMDSAVAPPVGYCVLATADDAEEIPPNVRSHFYVVRKNGSRRGPRGDA